MRLSCRTLDTGGEPGSCSFFAGVDNSTPSSTRGGGEGVVCNVVVERTGLVAFDDDPWLDDFPLPLLLDDVVESESSSLAADRATASASSLRLREVSSSFLFFSTQSTPSYHTPSSSLITLSTSSIDIFLARCAGSSNPRSVGTEHSMTSFRTRLRIGGPRISRIAFMCARYACSQSAYVGGASAAMVVLVGCCSSPLDTN